MIETLATLSFYTSMGCFGLATTLITGRLIQLKGRNAFNGDIPIKPANKLGRRV